jgi:hypothetical protein
MAAAALPVALAAGGGGSAAGVTAASVPSVFSAGTLASAGGAGLSTAGLGATGAGGLLAAGNPGFFSGLGKLFSGTFGSAFLTGAGYTAASAIIPALLGGGDDSSQSLAAPIAMLAQMGGFPEELGLSSGDRRAIVEQLGKQARISGLAAAAEILGLSSVTPGAINAYTQLAASAPRAPFPAVGI